MLILSTHYQTIQSREYFYVLSIFVFQSTVFRFSLTERINVEIETYKFNKTNPNNTINTIEIECTKKINRRKDTTAKTIEYKIRIKENQTLKVLLLVKSLIPQNMLKVIENIIGKYPTPLNEKINTA